MKREDVVYSFPNGCREELLALLDAAGVDDTADLLRLVAERDRLAAEVERRREQKQRLAAHAINTIKTWHGDVGWEIYLEDAPEMMPFQAALRGEEVQP